MSSRGAKNATRDPSVRPTGWTVEDYDHVVEMAELRSVRLVSVSFAVKPDLTSRPDERDLEYHAENTKNVVDEATGIGLAYVTFTVSAGRGRKRLLQCTADYVASYNDLAGCEEKAAQAYLGRVGLFACYPYFRSVFANLDWASLSRLPPLPVIKDFARKPKTKAQAAIEKPSGSSQTN